MRTLLQNLLNVFRLYKWATALNVVGLSLAFTVFYVILRQSWYEFNFNKSIKDHELVYCLEMNISSSGDSRSQTIFPHPVLTQIFQKTPYIKASGKKFFFIESVSAFSSAKQDDRVLSELLCIDKGYTDVFGFEWVSGDISAFEMSEKNIIIPQSLAQKIFGTSDVAGKTLSVQARDVSDLNIVAVYKDFPDNTSVSNYIYRNIGNFEADEWRNSNYEAYLKINDRNSKNNVERSIALPEEYWNIWGKFLNGSEVSIELFPIDDVYFHRGDDRSDKKGDLKITWLLLGIGCLILFIAVINFINFSMALAPVRIKNINTQKVLGATTMSLRIQYLLECVAISVIAYMFSFLEIFILCSSDITRLFITDVSLNTGLDVVAVCSFLVVIIGFLAGLWPSIYVTSIPPALALKGSYNRSPKGLKLRNILIGVQFTITFILLIVSMFVYLQNRYMLYSPLGLNKERVVAVNAKNGLFLYYNPGIEEEINKGLREYSGTQSLFHSDNVLFDRNRRIQGWGEYNEGGNLIEMKVLIVDRDFVPALDIEILEGRMANPDEKQKVLVNESARKQYGFKIGDVFRGYEVIGFIPDIKIFSFHESSSTPFGLFINDSNGCFYIKLASGIKEKDALNYCRNLMATVCPNMEYNVRMLTEEVEKLYEKDINQMVIITLFCGISMFIAIMGVFGLVIFELQSRRKEIGIRKVNGASALSVIALFNKTYIRIMSVCFVISVPVAWYFVQRWLEAYVYHIPIYWWIFAIAFIILSVITVLTVSLQCWHTANENPMKSIKIE